VGVVDDSLSLFGDELVGLEFLEATSHLVILDEKHVGADRDVVFLQISVESKEHLICIGQSSFLLPLLFSELFGGFSSGLFVFFVLFSLGTRGFIFLAFVLAPRLPVSLFELFVFLFGLLLFHFLLSFFVFGLFFFELILSSLKCTLSGHLLGSFDVLYSQFLSCTIPESSLEGRNAGTGLFAGDALDFALFAGAAEVDEPRVCIPRARDLIVLVPRIEILDVFVASLTNVELSLSGFGLSKDKWKEWRRKFSFFFFCFLRG